MTPLTGIATAQSGVGEIISGQETSMSLFVFIFHILVIKDKDHMKTRIFFLAFLVAATPLCAQRAATLPPVVEDSDVAVLTNELQRHVEWLASDALEGRGTGTPSIDLAAEYIAREFRRYGLEPAGEAGSYFQTFEVITGATSTGNALALLEDGDVRAFDTLQFMPYAFSLSGEFEGEPVFAGYGIVASDGTLDSYAGLDVEGKVVIVRAGFPDDADPHGPAAMLSSARGKELFARERGAAALLIIHDNEAKFHELHYDGSASSSSLPVGRITPEAAATILSAAGIDDGLDPMSRKGPHPRASSSRLQLRGRFSVTLTRKATRNVVALLPGTDPKLSDDVFVVGAHYDHLGWGQDGSLYRGAEPMIHNGADDNASGTAGVLELAEYFTAHPARRSMVFMAFSGEEMGLLGSSHWVDDPTIALENVKAMYNLDMVGRLPHDTRRLNVQGIGTSPVWKEMVEEFNDTERFDLALIDDGHGSSDHSSFYAKDIPVLFFFTGLHTDYHRPSDDADRVNYEGQTEVVRYISEVIAASDARDDIPFTRVVKAEEQRVARFNVYVGTIPDYANTEAGFRITGASPGSPAEKAGMQTDDIIVRFGDTEIKNIYDYMTALSRHSPGESVPVVVRRADGEKTLTVDLVSK
jgi:hypothetical protein